MPCRCRSECSVQSQCGCKVAGRWCTTGCRGNNGHTNCTNPNAMMLLGQVVTPGRFGAVAAVWLSVTAFAVYHNGVGGVCVPETPAEYVASWGGLVGVVVLVAVASSSVLTGLGKTRARRDLSKPHL